MTALTPAVRRYIYGVATAGLLVAGTYGFLNGEQVAAWDFLAAAVTGMATIKTDPRTPTGAPLNEENQA